MKDEMPAPIHHLCVQAFAEIFSSISHELKNTLAIINENSGLLDDFVLMAGESGTVESSRVQKATAAIQKQVTRSDKIIKNMNHFSHTTDTQEGSINIHDTLHLLQEMTARKAAGKELTVEIVGKKELNIDTEIGVFETLLYRVLALFYITETRTGAKHLQINILSDEQESRIAFMAMDFSVTVMDEMDIILETLTTYLRCRMEKENNQITIILKW